MDEYTDEPPIYPASRLVAYSAIAIGAGFMVVSVAGAAFAVVTAALNSSSGGIDPGLIVIGVFMVLMFGAFLSTPGLISVYYGRRLLRYTSPERVRAAVGGLAILMGLLVYAGITSGLELVTSNPISQSAPVLFGTVIIMLPIYAFVCRQILKHDGFEMYGYRYILTRRVLLVSAWLMWISLSRAAPTTTLRATGLGSALSMVYVVGPILIAWGFYKISMRILGHTTRSRDERFQLRPPENPVK